MTGPAEHFQRESLLFFIQLSQRKGISQRESLRRYRAAGYRVSDNGFRVAWQVMADKASTPAGRYSYDVKVRVSGD